MAPLDSEKNLRNAARSIFRAAIESVDPGKSVLRFLSWDGKVLQAGEKTIFLEPLSRIWVVGGGKGGGAMAAAVEQVLGERLRDGVVVVPRGCKGPTRTIRLRTAGHPFPDRHGLEGVREIRKLLGQTRPGDLVLCLLSGGASSLLPAPAGRTGLDDKVAISRALMEAGADIGQLNTVRKHLSELKGGGLVRFAAPARVVTLILSDVVDDRLDTIASGPTAGDPSTFGDALEIVTTLLPPTSVPPAVLEHLRAGARGALPETVKPDDPLLARVDNLVVGNNRMALEGAAKKAWELGFRTRILSSRITGEAREVGACLASTAARMSSSHHRFTPLCLLSGGETTVTVRGKGKGGRNQELVLSAAIHLEGLEETLAGAMGTDGVDGPTDAAGALADGRTTARGRDSGLDPIDFLERNDSYSFFQALEDLIISGPTGTNVMDLHLLLLAGGDRKGFSK